MDMMNRDGIYHISLMDGQARAILIESTSLVQKAMETHRLSRTATAALGRTLTATAMMGTRSGMSDASMVGLPERIRLRFLRIARSPWTEFGSSPRIDNSLPSSLAARKKAPLLQSPSTSI